jgi:ABC-type uncharacterized transport system substrate-binding protein
MAQESKKFKVLVVFSYEDNHPFTADYKEGIEPVLGNLCEIRYFFMNTKMNFNGGTETAKQAFALYQEFQPDGVIVADDDAQSMFVLPYLKDKVKTPIMFCGVNAEPEKYGYPTSNISGILERLHIRESVTLVQQLIPSAKTVGFMMKESPIATFVSSQVTKETSTYSAISVGVRYPKTLKEAITMAGEFKNNCDILFATALQGLLSEDGKPLEEKEMYKTIAKAFGKPVIGSNEYQVRLGALCSVVQRMQEQGETAAQMLLKAMQGTPVSQIPITQNKQGKAFVNITVLKALGINTDPNVLASVKLVRTEE